MGKLRYVNVRFDGSAQEYTYQSDITDLEVGDKVIVPARNQTVIVTVSSFPETSDYKNPRVVIAKIDLKEYEEKEKKVKRKAELYKALERKVVEHRLINEIKTLGDTDTIKLLEEYLNL